MIFARSLVWMIMETKQRHALQCFQSELHFPFFFLWLAARQIARNNTTTAANKSDTPKTFPLDQIFVNESLASSGG